MNKKIGLSFFVYFLVVIVCAAAIIFLGNRLFIYRDKARQELSALAESFADELEESEEEIDECVRILNILDGEDLFSVGDYVSVLDDFPKKYMRKENKTFGYFYTLKTDEDIVSKYYSAARGTTRDLYFVSEDGFEDGLKRTEGWFFADNGIPGVSSLAYLRELKHGEETIGIIGAVVNETYLENAYLPPDTDALKSSVEEIAEFDEAKEGFSDNADGSVSLRKVVRSSPKGSLIIVNDINVLKYQSEFNKSVLMVALMLILSFLVLRLIVMEGGNALKFILEKTNVLVGHKKSKDNDLIFKITGVFLVFLVISSIIFFLYSSMTKGSFYLPVMLLCYIIINVLKAESRGYIDEESRRAVIVSKGLDAAIVLLPAVFVFLASGTGFWSVIPIMMFSSVIVLLGTVYFSAEKSMQMYQIMVTSVFVEQLADMILRRRVLDSSELIFIGYFSLMGLIICAFSAVYKGYNEVHKENMQDLTAQVQETQSMLIQNERMSTLGRIMASISHEINTPMGAIKSTADAFNSKLIEALKLIMQDSKSYSDEDTEAVLKIIEISFESVKKMKTTSELRKGKSAVRKFLIENGVDEEKAFDIAHTLSRIEICDLDQVGEMMDILKSDNVMMILKTACDIFFLITGTNTIQLAANKISKIMYALRVYSNVSSASVVGEFNVTETIDNILTLYTSQFNSDITIDRVYQPGVPLILGNTEGLGQVCTNIIQNAFYAVKDGGNISITVKYDQNNVTVDFADTGCGIAEENLEKIFDPLYTTKPLGEGSGLGLGICQNIVEEHNGTISVKSKLGEGSTFTLSLPLTYNQASAKEE